MQKAEKLGPEFGWREGYLSASSGFCPPDPSASPKALENTPGFAIAGRLTDLIGSVWSDLCSRLRGIVTRGKIRESIKKLPFVDAGPNSIPDDALWAAVVCLGILASIYRYEEQNDDNES